MLFYSRRATAEWLIDWWRGRQASQWGMKPVLNILFCLARVVDEHGHLKIYLPKKLLECLPKCTSLPKERHRWNTNEVKPSLLITPRSTQSIFLPIHKTQFSFFRQVCKWCKLSSNCLLSACIVYMFHYVTWTCYHVTYLII